MAKRNLTDRLLRSLKPAKAGTRYELMDSHVRGFGVRVTDTGQRSFVLVQRFPGKAHPACRRIGSVGSMSLADARQKARHWLKLIGEGIDPAEDEQRIQRERQRERTNTFAAAVEEYIGHAVIGRDPNRPRQRKGEEVVRVFRQVLVPIWGNRPIATLSRADILGVVEGIRDAGTRAMLASHSVRVAKSCSRPAPDQARNVLGYLKTFFSWMIERGTYGVDTSPCDHLRAARIVGEKNSRDRILSDDELVAFWRATARLEYPWGPLYRLLLLTGLRLNEVADASWSEFDLAAGTWTIPAERMKGRNSKARAHVVPITADIAVILQSLPRFDEGDFLFSTMFGAQPAWLSTKVKRRLDRRMLRTLRALARSRGDDPARVSFGSWVNHDLRRTIRSGLSQLRIRSDVAEAILAHAKPGVRGVYDRFDYFDEKRQALEAWASRVQAIVQARPRTSNVVRFAAHA
jgi:integrase